MSRAPFAGRASKPRPEGAGEGILIVKAEQAAYLRQIQIFVQKIFPGMQLTAFRDHLVKGGARGAQHALERTFAKGHFRSHFPDARPSAGEQAVHNPAHLSDEARAFHFRLVAREQLEEFLVVVDERISMRSHGKG